MAARLVEEGRLGWDARLVEVAPELAAVAHDAYGDVTLEDLLLCEAGIAPFTDGAKEPLPSYDAAAGDPRWAFARDVLARPPAAARKAGRFPHQYSNASYTLAAPTSPGATC